MYNKNNIAVAKVASKGAIKRELNCVAFYGNRTVATDSFRLIEMSAVGDVLSVPVLVPVETLKSIKLKKGETIETEKLPEALNTNQYTYPDVDQVLKSHFDRVDDPESYSSIKLNAELLEQVLAVLKHVNTFKAVTLSVPTTPGRPVLIQAETQQKGKEQKARALVMPHNK